MPKRPLINIYLTSELKAEMDKRSDVNWSAVAREAFKAKLAEKEWMESEFGPYIAPYKCRKTK